MTSGAVARVRRDRHDAPDGDFGSAHQHGRGTGRVARRRDRAAAGRAGAPLERDARPGRSPVRRAALVYSTLAGLSVPTQRTLLMLVHLLRRALVSASARGHARARSGSHRRAADRPIRSARAGSMAVVRRSRDHPARRRRPRAARRADRGVRARPGRGHDRARAAAARRVRQHLADLAARECVAIPLFTLLLVPDRARSERVPRRCGCLPANGCWRCRRRCCSGRGRSCNGSPVAAGAVVLPAAARCRRSSRWSLGVLLLVAAGHLADAPGGRAAVPAGGAPSRAGSRCR